DTIVEEASIKLTDNQEIFDKLYELAGLSESDFPSLAGASVVFKGMMKKDLSEMAANVAVSILPGKTVNGVFAFDEKNFIFGIPEILGGEIFSSPRTDSYGEDVLAGLGEIDLSSLYNTDFYDSLLEDLETETLALFESLDYTVEGNYTVSVNNGKTVKLDRIDTYISAKRLTEFARDVLVRLQNNKELEDWYNDYMQTLDPYAEDYKGVMADLIETLEDELGYIEEEVGGIKLGFLVNKSNKDSGMVTEAIVDDEVTAEIIAAYVPGTGYEFAVKAPNDMRVSLYGDYDKNGSGYKGTASVAVDMGMLVTVDLGTYRYDKAGTELVLDLGKILSIPELADIAPQITGMLDELGIDSKGLKLRFAVKVKDLSTTISLESGKDALITLAVSLGNDNEKIEPKPTREFNDMDEAAEYIADYLLENEDALMEKLEEYLGITPELYEQLTALFAAEPDDLDPTIDVESTFGLGAWNEDRTFFFNSWSEIWFTVPNGFTVGSEEQMLGFMGLSYDDYLNSDLTYDEFVLEQAPGVYYDAYLVSKDGADIQIQYEDISGYGLDSSTLEELADIIAANYGDVQRLGAEGVVLGGLDYTHVSYTVNKNGTDIYLDFYLRRVGDYLVYMTLAGYTAENETQEFLNLIF
ncbi:MAG: hypothetical protein LBQ91_04520, partial [Oscillospiraceae bacterium]|nr:hypothetical protein [Oscillospiraceae bacterium]